MKTFEELDCWKKAVALRKKLIVAAEEKYITEGELNEMRKEVNECLAVLNGFINHLLKAKGENIIKEPQITYALSELNDTDN